MWSDRVVDELIRKIGMIRVLHVCETVVGGLATYLNLLSEVSNDVAIQDFLVPSMHCDSLSDRTAVTAYRSEARGLPAMANMVRGLFRYRRTTMPDVLFFHSTFALIALAALRIVDRRTPAIYCAHGWAISRYDEDSLKGRLVRLLEGRLCALADVVVNISHADLEIARRLGYRGRHEVIENAVTDAAPNARDDLFSDEPDALHLLFVGRFDRQKGLDVLLEAFARALQTRKDLRLHIVGASVLADGEPIELPEGATLSGWVDPVRIDDWYRSADALVVPSRWEGFGLVVPEALRNGSPVLVSNQGALPSLIRPDVDGTSFTLDVGALTKTLTELERNKLRTMRPEARASYEARFRPERLRREIVDLLQEVAA